MTKTEENELKSFIEIFRKNHNKKYVDLFLKLPKENQNRIKALHKSAFFIVNEIDSVFCQLTSSKSPAQIKRMEQKIDDLNDVLKCLEYAMQWEWGFEKDSNYHTWWMKSKNCLCPKIDNSEMLGFGRIVTSECPIHARQFKKTIV